MFLDEFGNVKMWDLKFLELIVKVEYFCLSIVIWLLLLVYLDSPTSIPYFTYYFSNHGLMLKVFYVPTAILYGFISSNAMYFLMSEKELYFTCLYLTLGIFKELK